ncbi:MAG: hypothetical protein IJO70_01820 [Lachnospiraceae bacterium]|nr:hypothetical protein [Lachnospiraceae bacterium]
MRKIMKKLSAIALAIVMVVAAIGVLPASNVVKASSNPTVKYMVHRQTYSWEKDWKSNGQSSGTVGEGKRLESIKIKVEGANLGVQYRTHIQSFGWEADWRSDGALSGTEGKAKRLEAIQIKLTGADANKYDIYYRVHAQTYGWMGWVKNGESAGTAGQSKRLEAIQIVILPAGTYPSEGSLGCGFVDIAKKPSHNVTGAVTYMTHVQSYGDQKWVSDGSIAGTSGEAKRLEQISIKVNSTKLSGASGSVEYKTHVQSYGWMNWVKDGARSGTSGQGKRLEAIKIRLTGDLANRYDIYYRVHAQTYGWLGWVKNGAPSGTEGYGKRLEAIQIVIVPKNTPAPNHLPAKSGQSGFVSKTGTCSDKDDPATTVSRVPSNRYFSYIIDGNWYFSEVGKGNYKYNIASGVLQNYPSSISAWEENPMDRVVVTTNSGIADYSTNKEIFTLKSNQSWGSSFCDDRALVIEKTESYTGNTYSYGIINEKAQWVMPMSTGFPWEGNIGFNYLGDDYYEIHYKNKLYILDGKTKKVYDNAPEEFLPCAYMNGKIYGKVNWRNFGIYDIKTGEYNIIRYTPNNPHEASWDANFWTTCTYKEDDLFWFKEGGKVYGIDGNGTVKVTYDVSKYAEATIYSVSKDGMCFEFDNGSNVKYIGFIKPNGSLMFEPLKKSNPAFVVYDDGNLILKFGDSTFVYNKNTNKQTTIVHSNQYYVMFYDKETNMFVVTRYGDYAGAWLVNINDLNTLINPFE